MKRIFYTLALVSMLLMIPMTVIIYAESGAHVDSHWWDITVIDEMRLEKALQCEIDALGVPYPEALDDLMDAGFTITTTQRLGYTMLFENNRVWPTGGPDGTGHPEFRSINFRKALHRLVPKADCVALFAPLNSACEWWLPYGQAYWINPAAPAPTWDSWIASAFLDAGGFTEDPALGANPYYDPDYPGSAQYLRKDPMYGGPVAFEYYAIGPVEAPLGFEMAQLITEHFRKAGLTVDLVAGTYFGLLFRLINDDLYDYQFMTGIGMAWDTTAPDVLYDLTYSENRLSWNFAAMNISALDEAGRRMMSTLNLAACRAAAYDIQTLLCEYEPFMPMLLDENFYAFKGPSREPYPLGDITWPDEGTHPGAIGIVNAVGYGPQGFDNLNVGLLKPPSAQGCNPWGKMLGRAGRYDLPDPNEERNLWGLDMYLDTLNPLMADTASDWQVLSLVEDYLFKRHPYTMDYMWWGAEDGPTMEAWIGPGRKQIGGNGVYDATYTGTHYNGIPLADVTADDLVGDDQLGMVTTWKMREGMYWHDSDPGPDGIYGTADDGELHEVTAADMVWGLNLIRDQTCDRYQTQWWFIYAVEQVDQYTVKICEERRYLYAFEGHNDVALLTPKHIWEGFIGPTYDIASLPITLPDGTISYGDEITAWANHHEDWVGWYEEYMPDPQYRDPDTGAVAADAPMLTYLIGFGPFKYHLGGWEVGTGAHLEDNLCYFGGRICPADVNFDRIVNERDLNAVIAAIGQYRVDPNYDVRCDICYPAQVIDTTEVYTVQYDHFNHTWGPGPPPRFDVAVLDVTPSKTVVDLGDRVNITARVENQGDYTESFNVTAYADLETTIIGDEIVIGKQEVTLTSGVSTTITYVWDTTGVPYGNYTISAGATPVLSETDTADNLFTDGKILVYSPPENRTDVVIETIETLNLPTGTENSLTAKLETVLDMLDKGNEVGAVHKLMDFIKQVEALRGKKLTDEQADYLTAEAQGIIDQIEG